MSYRHLLFDLDNTLIDFSGASKLAIKQVLSSIDVSPTEDILSIYHSLNAQVWHSFENGKISGSDLRWLRFAKLLDHLKIRDQDPYALNVKYLDHLVQETEPYEGVISMLEQFRAQGLELSIITNGFMEVQRPRLDKTALTDFFDHIIVSDEIGVSKPNTAFFDYTHYKLGRPDKKEVLVIGDSLRSDIRGGHHYGLDTCWISHGERKYAGVRPSMIIDKSTDLPRLLEVTE